MIPIRRRVQQTARKSREPLHSRWQRPGLSRRGRRRGPTTPGTLSELALRSYDSDSDSETESEHNDSEEGWTETVVQVPYEGSIFEQVFSVHTVWRVVGSFLNFSDLKDCRLVSRNFDKMILEATNFKNRGFVNAKPEVLTPDVLGTTKEAWKNMKISVRPVCTSTSCDPAFVYDTDWLYSLLKQIQEIWLVLGPPCPMNDSSSQRLRPFPARILEKSPDLRVLVIDQELLYTEIFNDCCHELTKLLQLKIITPGNSSCRKELKALKSLAMFVGQLQVFESSVKFDYSAEDNFIRNKSHVTQIVEGNQAYLKSLNINGAFLWEPQEDQIYSFMRHKAFPQLRSIRLCLTWANESEVIHFLKNQMPLEEIEIDLCSQYHGLFPKEVLATVGLQSERLKMLRISASNYKNIDLTDWNFLSLAPLEELSLWPLDNGNYQKRDINQFGGIFIPEVFKLLPHTTRKVRLQGANDVNFCHQPIFIRDWESISPTMLTHLSISGLQGALTDRNLKFIFRKFHLLRELHLFHIGSKITDSSFTLYSGFGEMKGLRSLTLSNCEGLTDGTLTDGIRFRELKYLDVSCNPQFTHKACEALVEKNPSLEIFINDCGFGFRKSTEIPRKFRRLKCSK